MQVYQIAVTLVSVSSNTIDESSHSSRVCRDHLKVYIQASGSDSDRSFIHRVVFMRDSLEEATCACACAGACVDAGAGVSAGAGA